MIYNGLCDVGHLNINTTSLQLENLKTSDPIASAFAFKYRSITRLQPAVEFSSENETQVNSMQRLLMRLLFQKSTKRCNALAAMITLNRLKGTALRG